MNQADAKKFTELMVSTGERYGTTVSAERMRLYFEDLSEFQIDDVIEAVRQHVRDSVRGRFFPTIADLIDKLEGSLSDKAAAAWSEAVRLGSNYRAAVSNDPIAECAIASMGGWQRIGNADDRDLRFMAKEFAQLYSIHARRRSMPSLSNDFLKLVKKP